MTTNDKSKETHSSRIGEGSIIVVIGLSLILIFVFVFVLVSNSSDSKPKEKVSTNNKKQDINLADETKKIDQNSDTNPLPKMIDLGSKNCIPCKQMAPILEELKQDYKHKFETIFIDVNENGAESAKYNIRLIPTQIFFDENGKEIHRHVGFMSKEAILQAWHDLGYDF